MKRLLTILTILVCTCPSATASWVLNGSSQSVQTDDAAVLTLPDSAWSVFGWVKLDDNSGTTENWVLSMGTGWAIYNAGFHLRFFGHSQSNANKLSLRLFGSGGSSVAIVSSTTPGTSRDWQHIAVVRWLNGATHTYTLYVDGARVAETTANSLGSLNADTGLIFGNYFGKDSSYWLDASLAEWGKANAALTSTQLAMLSGTGAYEEDARAPNDPAVGLTLSWYFDMHDAVDCTVGELSITNNGTVTANSGDHPITYEAGAPTTPSPANSATGVRRNVTSIPLSWAASDGATGYYVYIGTSESAVSEATTESPECKADVASAGYIATGLLPGTHYFWRVDAYNGVGATKGSVWNFTTRTQRQVIKGS